MESQSQWMFYLAGAFLALFWKYFSWVYVGVCRKKQSFAASSREWLELTTIDSKVSWIATAAFVWVIGTVYIQQIGVSWFLGGFLSGVPVVNSIAFALGAVVEYSAPAALKWIVSKIPFAKMEG